MSRYLNATIDFPQLLSHEHKPICVWCGKPLGSVRRKYCSPECSDEVGLRCGYGVRWKLKDRDKGICARCGRDCVALEKALSVIKDMGMPLAGWAYRGWRAKEKKASHLASALGITPEQVKKSLWDAHHKKAVADGGGACGLDNLETVCIWCHKKESANQKANAAQARRVARQGQLPLLKTKEQR